MLKNIPKNLSPALLEVMMSMGHGDELVLADGNFPAAEYGKRCIRADGLGIPELLSSILTLLPLDTYVGAPVALMELVSGETYKPVIWDEYKKILSESCGDVKIEQVERFAFYERAKKAFAVVATGEEAIYANIILKKGVVK